MSTSADRWVCVAPEQGSETEPHSSEERRRGRMCERMRDKRERERANERRWIKWARKIECLPDAPSNRGRIVWSARARGSASLLLPPLTFCILMPPVNGSFSGQLCSVIMSLIQSLCRENNFSMTLRLTAISAQPRQRPAVEERHLPPLLCVSFYVLFFFCAICNFESVDQF